MTLIFNIIGICASFLGIYLVYFLRKQSQLYVSPFIDQVEFKNNFTTEKGLSSTSVRRIQTPSELLFIKKAPTILYSDKKTFQKAISRHLIKSIYLVSNSNNAQGNPNPVFFDEIFSVYENVLKNSKFSNPLSLYKALYKTSFSSEIIEVLKLAQETERDKYMVNLYTELIKSLSLYDTILKNESGFDADIIDYNVKLKNYFFHYDTPDNKLNQIMVSSSQI